MTYFRVARRWLTPCLTSICLTPRNLARRLESSCRAPNGHSQPQKAPRFQKTMEMAVAHHRSEEHTSELQSLMRISYAVFCLKKKKKQPKDLKKYESNTTKSDQITLRQHLQNTETQTSTKTKNN